MASLGSLSNLLKCLLIRLDLRGRTSSEKVVLPDAEWIWIGNPKHPEHDRYGMRNKNVPQSIDILVLGNSQSYCKLIKREESWPSILDTYRSGGVYNCSVNGWTILQMYAAFEKFKHMDPKHVLLTVYPGFEIYEVFRAVRESLLIYASKYKNSEIENIPFVDLSNTDRARSELSTRLAHNKASLRPDILKEMQLQSYANTKDVRIGCATYFLQDDWRGRSMDLNHPAVRKGCSIFKDIFIKLLQSCNKNGINLKVVLIPTKEYLCYCERDRVTTQFLDDLCVVGKREQALRDHLIGFFQENSVDVIDPVNVLRDSLDKVFHPDTENGHYAAYGTKVIGEYIYNYMEQGHC
jgi:hypothetical protein